MSRLKKYNFKKVRDFNTGEVVKLALVLKEEYPNKDYDLYMVCKVVNNELVHLYNETFTDKQIDEFYNEAAYYEAKMQE